MLNRTYASKIEDFESDQITTINGVYRIKIRKETNRPLHIWLQLKTSGTTHEITLPSEPNKLKCLIDELEKVLWAVPDLYNS